MSELPSDLSRRIEEHGQSHLLRFWDELTEANQRSFLNQLESIDFGLFASLKDQSASKPMGRIEPAQTCAPDATCKSIGEKILRSGELGVLTLAGGQGSRLGWSGPKGTFPATPVTGKSLFQVIAEQIVFATKKYGMPIPWYIMTSEENDASTRSFLLDNNCFGLDRTDIFLFKQGEVPVVDKEGKMLLAEKGKIAVSPDGSGGVLGALQQSGALEEMESRGVQYLSYLQIDNPLVHAVDPVFLGMHVSGDSSQEVTSKFVKKTNPSERVGVFCSVDGRLRIVEYSELPPEKAKQTDANGELIFQAGSIAIHIMSPEFLKNTECELPWHLAHKKVSYIDIETGERVVPDTPNAYKYERFVFDILPLARCSIVVETCREEEFAPIKNETGQDSKETSQAMQLRRAICWLEANGIEVNPNARVEISALTASCSEDLQGLKMPTSVGEHDIVVL